MTELALRRPLSLPFAGMLYGGAIFLSAGLVFLVQPMIARMMLPTLGGSPAVWNASMAFFQLALLGGYAYAHGLQRLPSLRAQAGVHLAVLVAAGLFLPVRIHDVFGLSPVEAPTLWLLGVLIASIGAPFMALSATAPLMQAWFARSRPTGDAANPYVLYAASNIGSLLALAAYPLIVDPSFDLDSQGRLWTAGYALFVGAAVVVALTLRGAPAGASAPTLAPSPPIAWSRKLALVGLAAVPSSLLLGVTSHISTDVASAPFLWVLPLALYLLTFAIAFQTKPAIPPRVALLLQALAVAYAAATLFAAIGGWTFLLGFSLVLFFLTALVCHQKLSSLRPEPARLTEFYLLISLGGVVGGAFTAFVAPIAFDFVWEYPAALVLAGLARPWGAGPLSRLERIALFGGAGAMALASLLMLLDTPPIFEVVAFAVTAGALLALRDRALLFTVLLAALTVQTSIRAANPGVLSAERGFFGVHRVASHTTASGAEVTLLFHGTTIHGAQSADPARRCRPMTYYTPETPLGRTFAYTAARKPQARLGVTGLGAGSVAAFVRPGDQLRFFEIDPLVAKIASDPERFTYLSDCARGPVDIVLGDARLTLAREPSGGFDHLLMDAFSSDSVPTHLLTREAMTLYLDKLAPDGLLVVHLTNRHLELSGPVAAAVREAGGHALVERFRPAPGSDLIEVAGSKVLVAAKDPAVLEPFRRDGRWKEPAPVRSWTDDHVDLIGAMRAGARERGAQPQAKSDPS